LIKLAVYLK